MQALKRRTDFFNSEEGQDVRLRLERMLADHTFNTQGSYTSNSILYPNNLMPFVDKHMNYLNVHPQLDIHMYLTNLRLMTRVR